MRARHRRRIIPGRGDYGSATTYDPLTQTVRLRGPTRVVDLRVDDPEQFKLVAVGDQVEATYTEAVAISVEPAGEPQ